MSRERREGVGGVTEKRLRGCWMVHARSGKHNVATVASAEGVSMVVEHNGSGHVVRPTQSRRYAQCLYCLE